MSATPGTRLAKIAIVAALSIASLGAGSTSAQAASSCGILNASGRTWIIVVKAVPCPTAKTIVRRYAARTAALRSGQRIVVSNPPAGGFETTIR